jgi:hypothetical protein
MIRMNREFMEKVAQARWRREIDKIQDREQMKNFVSHFNRNDSFRNAPFYDDRKPLYEAATGKIKDKSDIKRAISTYINRPRQDSLSLKDLTPKQIKRRRNWLEDAADERRFALGVARRHRNNEQGGYGALSYSRKGMTQNPEEYVPFISGTNRAKGTAFLQGGNAGNQLESPALLPNGKLSGMGLQVHSHITERAPAYARMQADRRGGAPAIVKGMIKRKYLYPNANHGNSGDEYGIPRELFSKIKDGRVEDLYGNILYKK